MKSPHPFDTALTLARKALRQRPSGLFTDVDGTISQIVVDPGDARVPQAARRALRRLRDRIEVVAAVSGRAATDARRMVGVGGISYIGNHGLERLQGRRRIIDPDAAPYLPAVQLCADNLRSMPLGEDIVVENKLASITVHYRTAPDPSNAERAIHRAIAACEPCKRLQAENGRKVVNLVPPVAINKGTAVRRIAEQHSLKGIVCLGDDVTDIDAFKELRELRNSGARTAAIAVGSTESPPELLANADAVVPGVDGIVELLARLSVDELGMGEVRQ